MKTKLVMELTDTLKIERGAYDFVLVGLVEITHCIKKTTRKVWKDLGYYSSVVNAIKAALSHDINKSNDLNDIIKRIDTFEKIVLKNIEGNER